MLPFVDPSPKPSPRWRTPQGAETHRAILKSAVDLAATEGLAGLTLGRLALGLGMSKSGLFAHFGSKEELQLAVLDTANATFFDDVVRPAMEAEVGLPRLKALCEGWLGFGDARSGCFFAAVSMEFDARPGPIRDRVVKLMRVWLSALESAITVARDMGQLDPTTDAAQLAFELNAIELAANWSRLLFGDEGATARARTAIWNRLDAAIPKAVP